jgi:hypothetical protein
VIEDKLDREERLRLECIAQANVAADLRSPKTAESIILTAKKFEAYITKKEK